MAYSNRWNSTDQVPERGLATGQIPRFGAEDPSDGGNTERFSLSARVARSDAAGYWKANAYVIQSSLDLYNNFTYFLSNPIQGDQFHQHDGRIVTGANVARTFRGTLASLPVETTLGVQTRYDAIDLALTNTYQRSFLSRCSYRVWTPRVVSTGRDASVPLNVLATFAPVTIRPSCWWNWSPWIGLLRK